MNNNNIVFSKKKIYLILPIILASAVVLGSIAMGNDVFATLDCCSFKQTPPNAPNTGGGSNTANQAINQANKAANAALCAAGTLTGAACNTATSQTNANTGSNTAGQTAGGGIGTGAAGGGQRADFSNHHLHIALSGALTPKSRLQFQMACRPKRA